MTQLPIADTGPRMGRPPLKRDVETKPTMVRLAEDTRQRIEAVAGKNRMAAFIREAIENELGRREKARTRKED